MKQEALEARPYEGEGIIMNAGDVIAGEIEMTEGGEAGELVTQEAGEGVMCYGESLEERAAIETVIR